MSKYLFVAVLLFVLCIISPATANEWHELAPVPIAEQNTSAHVLLYDGKDSIYLTGGYVYTDRTVEGPYRISDEFFRYQISTNTWSRAASSSYAYGV